MDFGNQLKKLRLQSGLTQKQLGEQIGLSKSVISFYERHDRCPSPEILVKLASVFHVTSDLLLGIETADSVNVSGLIAEDIVFVRSLIDLLRKKNKS